MKLCYRGTTYESNPVQVKVEPGAGVGSYRGVRYHPTVVVENPVPQPVLSLTYRGVAYQTNAQGQVVNLVSAPKPEPAIPALQVATFGRHRQLPSGVLQAHRRSILNTLEHRLQVAYQKGDQHLIHLLELERNQFA
jgi:Domain of unknown function (DUF4278)